MDLSIQMWQPHNVSLAILLQQIGNFSEAESFYRQALNNYETKFDSDNPDIALVLSNLSNLLQDMGRYSEAKSLYLRTLDIWVKVYGDEHPHVATTLNDLGNLLQDLGSYPEAESFYRRALVIDEKTYGNEHPNIAINLNNLANLLTKLGENIEAEQLYRRALNVWEQKYGTSHPDVALVLNNLARLLSDLDRNAEAEPLLRRSLAINEEFYGCNHPDVAAPLSNLARLLSTLGNLSEAEHLCRRGLKIREMAYGPTHPDVALSLIAYSRLMRDNGLISESVFLGKRAINILQKIRGDVSQINTQTLSCYDQTIENDYRSLAEMLISSDRILEAEYVLGLFKEHDYFDYVRSNSTYSGITLPSISYNQVETLLDNSYNKISQLLFTLHTRIKYLLEIKSRSIEEESELYSLQNRIDAACRDFDNYFDKLHECFGSENVHGNEIVTDIMQSLWELDDQTAVIYTLSTKETFYSILVTGKSSETFSYDISSDVLSKKVLSFRNLIMSSDKFDVESIASEFYDIILRQLEPKLKESGINTLLWVLEGSLRLLPVSALYDGTDYIVNRYRNVYLTTKSRDNLAISSIKLWNVLGMGVTQAHGHFKSLPAVKDELEGIINTDILSSGILPGEILFDGEFTWDSMSNKMAGTFQAVHIASHFNLDPCNETMSYLLLGDGNHLTLEKLKCQQLMFNGVDLLVLSACSTGLGSTSKSGREIDGIGYIAEAQGAKAVLATLWPVADESTSLLMKDFYKRKQEGAAKNEALRQAQLSMLNGKIKPTGQNITRSVGELYRFETDSAKPYAHPYYWAPFILIGNYL